MAYFKIASKRVYKETDKALVILTSGYGGRFVSLPKSQITKRKTVTNQYGEDWVYIDLKDWLFTKLEKDISSMMDIHYKLITR